MEKQNRIGLALACVAWLGAAGAQAQTVTTALGTDWFFTTNGGTDAGAFSGSCSASAGVLLSDANTADGDGDMYDNAWGIWVDGTPLSGALSISGSIATVAPQTLSGLSVSSEYRFSDTIEAFRLLASFTNPTGSPISVTVEVPANFGSDSNTTLVSTSSGDATFDLGDNWAQTWDTSSEINTSVFYLPGAGLTPSSYTQTVFNCAGNQGLGATFALTVPANSTRRLMFFAGIGEIDGSGSTDTANATANAQQFNSFETIDSSLTAGISPAEASEIVNATATATEQPAAPIPVLPLPLLVLLAGGLGSLGLRRLSTRR